MSSSELDRLGRWRMILGGDESDGIGETAELGPDDLRRDAALASLYDGSKHADLGRSAPKVARWLGDIRTYFPSSIVQVMQADAMDRLGLRHLLLEPEMLDAVQPDIEMVSTLMALGKAIPEESRETARAVVRSVTDELESRLRRKTEQAVSGALNRAARMRRPRHSAIDWHRTIAANLRHYQAEYSTIVPERLIGFGRKATQVERDVILCIDQSGSMAESIVYSSVFGAVLASMRALSTRLVVFDTTVVDLTDDLDDPVDVVFGVQLGGGTDINGAIAYCEQKVARPNDTIMVLISDLHESGAQDEMLRRMRSLSESGVAVICLLALSDSGAPSYDADNAAALNALGIPAFACTPDLFPELMAAAVERRDVAGWVAQNVAPSSVVDSRDSSNDASDD